MASYGAFLAACGYESHGPKGHLGFAPKVRDGKTFKAAFTAAGCWGTYEETTEGGTLEADVSVKYGTVTLKTFGLSLPAGTSTVMATLDGKTIACSIQTKDGATVVAFPETLSIAAGQTLTIRT